MPSTFTKDEVSRLDYTFDWTNWLSSGDGISSVEFNVPNGLQWVTQGFTGKTATVWLQGGTEGETYNVDCIITTTSQPSRIAKRTISVSIT
jgi:hypothetical protein